MPCGQLPSGVCRLWPKTCLFRQTEEREEPARGGQLTIGARNDLDHRPVAAGLGRFRHRLIARIIDHRLELILADQLASTLGFGEIEGGQRVVVQHIPVGQRRQVGIRCSPLGGGHLRGDRFCAGHFSVAVRSTNQLRQRVPPFIDTPQRATPFLVATHRTRPATQWTMDGCGREESCSRKSRFGDGRPGVQKPL